MSTRQRTLIFAVAVAALLTSLLAGCRAEQRGLGRDELLRSLESLATPPRATPTREALLERRFPDERDAPTFDEAMAEDPFIRFTVAALGGEVSAAQVDAAAKLPPQTPQLLTQLCLLARALDDGDAILIRCATALDAGLPSPVASGVLAALWAARDERPEVYRRIVDSEGQWRKQVDQSPEGVHFIAALNRVAIESAEWAGDFARVDALVESSGRLTSARIDGPYAGDAMATFWRWREDQGRSQDRGPRAESLDATAPVSALNGPTLNWQAPFADGVRQQRTVSRSHTSSVGQFAPARRNEPGVYRLQFHTTGRGEGAVVVDSTLPTRVMVDGTEVLLKGADRSRAMSQVTLDGTRHLVEVIVAAAGFSRDVSIAFLNTDGRPLLIASPSPPEDSTSNGRVVRFAAWSPPSLDTAPPPSDLAEKIAGVTSLLLRADEIDEGFVDDTEAEDIVVRLLREFGQLPAAQFAAARLIARFPGANAPGLRARRLRLLDEVRTRWPEHAAAWIATIDDVSGDQPAVALAAARRAFEVQPKSVRIAFRLALKALSADARDEAFAAAKLGMELGATEEMVDAALAVFEAANRFADVAHLRVLKAERGNRAGFEERVRLALDRGQTGRALELLDARHRRDPGSASEELRFDLMELNGPERLRDEVIESVTAYPNDRSLALRYLALLPPGTEASRASAQALLRRFGADREVSAWAVDHGVTDPAAAALEEGDRLAAEFFARPVSPFEGQRGGFILDSTQFQFFRDGGYQRLRHQLYEVQTKEAIDAWGEVALSPEGRLARLIVRKPDGTIVQPERHETLGTGSFTDLAPHDVIEILRITDSPASVGNDSEEVGGAFLTLESALERRIAFLFPKEVDLPVDVGRAHPFPQTWNAVTVETGGGIAPAAVSEIIDGFTGDTYVVKTYSVRDVEGLRPEGHAAQPEFDLPFVVATRGLDTRSLAAARWSQNFREPAAFMEQRRGGWLQHVAEAVTRGSDDAFASLFSFVVREIEAGSSTSPEESLVIGSGDRTALLFELALRSGLHPRLVAIHLPFAGRRDLPSTDRFGLEGVLVSSTTHGEQLAVVGGGAAVLNMLPPAADATLLNAGLFADGEVLPLPVATMRAPPLDVRLSLALRPASLGAATREVLDGVLSLRVPPHRAQDLRRAFRGSDDTGRRAAFEAVLGRILPGVLVHRVRVPNLDDDGAVLGIGVEMTVPIDGQRLVEWPALFSDSVGAALGMETGLKVLVEVPNRKRTLVLLPQEETFQMQIDLGEQGTFTGVPSSFEVEAGPVRAKQTVEVADGQMRVTRTFSSAATLVDPDAFQALRPQWVALLSRLQLSLGFLVQPSRDDSLSEDAASGGDRVNTQVSVR